MEREKEPFLNIATALSAQQILDKLDGITANEFQEAIKSPKYKYYGKINGSEFTIRNKKYSPFSNGPSVKGKISEQDNIVTLVLNIDIEEQMFFIKNLFIPYSQFIGLIIIIAGFFINEKSIIVILTGALMIIYPILFSSILKLLIKSMRKDELTQFVSLFNS